jgi:hypothetical protein
MPCRGDGICLEAVDRRGNSSSTLIRFGAVPVDLLLWASIEDAIAEGPKADCRIVMGLGTIVQVHSQQANMIPDRRRDRGDKEENRCGEEEEDSNPGSLSLENAKDYLDAFHDTNEFWRPKP